MRYVTPVEAAKIMGVNQDHVRSLIAYGKLSASNISLSATRPRWRINVDDITAYMESRKHKVMKSTRRKRDPRLDCKMQYITR